ncbi:D-glycerate 2-kinase [hydrothermal vent metagenome]|uniref:D-glycerate 2-kinase n=1 Tax=hydrothermal vent metagenome TaxID=652676 RepID=A0A3B1AI66_9ZZZZ
MNLQQVNGVRDQLLTMFSIALSAVDGQQSTHAFISRISIATTNVRVIAIGKAASAMMQGASLALGDKLRSGLVITKPGHGLTDFDKRITTLESDHPVPSARSLDAGERLLEFVKQVNSDELLLVLISGGTSSLVEVLDETVTLEQLIKLNNWCLANPFSISQINALRQCISKIKAGRLINYINTGHIIQLTISDVQGNDLSVIGSGLLVDDMRLKNEDVSVLGVQQSPAWLVSLIRNCSRNRNEAYVTSHNNIIEIQQHIIADNQTARDAILTYAQQQELSIHQNQEIYLEVTLAAEQIAKTIVNGEPGVYVWGGECVVALPDNPGQGGRCQSLALAIAEYIKGMNIVMLVAGTDGSDGPGEAAGALIDGLTIQRGEELGLSAAAELERANAGYYLSETGDLIDTGPTNTNVMDLIIALKHPD